MGMWLTNARWLPAQLQSRNRRTSPAAIAPRTYATVRTASGGSARPRRV